MPEEQIMTVLVICCDPSSCDLTVQKKDGTTGIVPYQEITRQSNLSPYFANRQAGCRFFMLSMPNQPGKYSIKAYEDLQFDQIRKRFFPMSRMSIRQTSSSSQREENSPSISWPRASKGSST